MKAAFHSSLVTRHFPLPLLLQPEEQVARGRGEGDAVRAVGGADGITARRPAARCRQVSVLLQGVAAGCGPRHGDRVPTMRHGERWQARRLHHGDKTPEPAGHGIISTAHRAAGVRLADGAAYGIASVRARAAAAGDLIPVNGIALPLRPKDEGRSKNDETK